jgi:hypothetical protein
MNPVPWKNAAFGLLLLVLATLALLRVESTSVWWRAPGATPSRTRTNGAGGLAEAPAAIHAGGMDSCTSSSSTGGSGEAWRNVNHGASVRTTPVSNNTISPGELPGYTGWSRPATTLAHHFDIRRVSSTAPATGHNWTVTAHCRHPQARSGGAQFYVRAYGPSILPGRVTDHQNGTYEFTLLPFDAGVYHMEVVLVFSLPPAWTSLPNDFEPGYEGYLLPGFPIELSVGAQDPDPTSFVQVVPKPRSGPSKPKSKSRRLCNMAELTETSTHSAVETGRWRVYKKNVDVPYRTYREPTFAGYQRGDNSLGIQMEHVPVHDCEILTEQEAFHEDTLFTVWNSTSQQRKPIHVVLIGDSNLRMQRTVGTKLFGGRLEMTHVITNGGLVERLPSIQAELQDLAQQQQDQHFVVVFNSGLHDIANLCTQNDNTTFPPDFSCGDVYRSKLKELVDVVKSFPAVLRVWQTTPASWPKWGVYGNAWTPKAPQRLPKAPNVCAYFNEIAWTVMSENNIPVQDTYWLTLSRPDHRQVDAQNKVSNHLMHAGPEVYSILVRKWAMMILDVFRTVH